MMFPGSETSQSPDVLVIDDQPSVLTSMVAVLKVGGFSAYGVTSAEEALGFVREHTPKVLLVDVQLGASSGIDLAKQIAERIHGIRVILLTGDPEMDSIQDAAKQDGFRFEVMSKPVHPQQLFSLLSKAS